MIEIIKFKRITYKDIIYELDTKNKTAAVIGYKGNPIDVKIPDCVKYRFRKYKVTFIKEVTFAGCSSLTSVDIPNSVTSIGASAFQNCSGLTNIILNNKLKTIGQYAFSDCNNLTSITIPDGVTSIGASAFQNCSGLTSITIGNGVTVIENYTFNACSSLTSITIPDGVTSIGDHAFQSCRGLTSITIGNGVTKIGLFAFRSCTGLTSVKIPDGVTSIGNGAFQGCSSLTSVDVPNNVTFIKCCAFDNVGLTLPKRYTEDGKLIAYKGFDANMKCRNFQYEEGKSYKIKGLIKLCNCGFHACTNLLDIFNYYSGKIGKDVVIHEVYLSGDIDEDNIEDSKVCASKIEIGRRLSIKDINEIISKLK